MSLTPLVNLPSPSDPANFAAEADNFLTVQLPNLVNEWNTDIALFNNQDTRSSSTTSLLIGTGTKSLTVGTGKMYQRNMTIRIASSAVSGSYMDGLITSYNSSSGALVVNVEFSEGSGTLGSWNTFLIPSTLSTLDNPVVTGNLTVNGFVKSKSYTFSAYQSTAQSLSAGIDTKLLFQTEEFDTDSAFASSTFTAPIAGIYFFKASFRVASTLTFLSLFAYVNGVLSKELSNSGDGAESGAQGSCILSLTAGQTVEIYGNSNVTQNTLIGSAITYFQGYLINAA